MATRKFLFMSSEGYYEEQAATDEAAFGKITVSGVSGVALDAGNAKIVNLANPVADTDASNKAYVDAVAQGLQVNAAVDAVKTGGSIGTLSGLTTTVDGVALDTDGMEVLLTEQSTGSQNGPWVVHTGAWTRPLDFATGSHAQGAFHLAVTGTDWRGSGWVCTTKGPNDVVGTDSLTFTQFHALQDVTASTGLTMVGTDVRVKSGDGIEVTSNTASTNIALDTTPGLALVGTSGSKKLSWKPDTMRGLAMDSTGAYVELPSVNPGLHFDGSGNIDAKLYSSGGLEALSGGLSIKIDSADTNLALGAGGLKALHSPDTAPMLYTIAGVAAGDAVYYSAADSVSTGSSSADATARIVGVAPAAVDATSTGRIVASGKCPGILVGATANTPYYLGTNGQPVLATAVIAGKRNICLGYAVNATDLWVEIKDYGKKAS